MNTDRMFTVAVSSAFVLVAAMATAPMTYAWISPDPLDIHRKLERASALISGDNAYVVWWTDENTPNSNGEVLFRASTDGGATFGNKTNLSNTTGADSVDAQITAEGGNVLVTWWERNQTADEPVARISTDSGATFGDLLKLATNGTLGEETTEEEE
jgi:hypothetical protein